MIKGRVATMIEGQGAVGKRRVALLAAVCAPLAIGVAIAPVAAGKDKQRIAVRPGSHAIARALDRAKDGSVLRIRRGHYDEALTVDKRVKLVGAGRRRPVIDGGCDARITVAIRADGVRLKRLKVVGADASGGRFPTEVDFNGVSGGRATDLVLRDTCDAEYGVNVYETGSIGVFDSRAVGFDDAGFYVGEISVGPVEVAGNKAYGNNRGAIVENSEGPVAGTVEVSGNNFHHNDIPGRTGPVGLLINNSDGVLAHGNVLSANGMFGLDLAPSSDRNVVTDNVILGNPIDIRDQGSGNCGSGNEFASGDPLAPC